MKKTTPGRSRNQLRIIGGKWRGRKLDFPSVAGLRPTGDRIRETLFNWLAPYITGARCLDLFAGSGALGLEALSRGAEYAAMLDTDARVIRQLQDHCNRLDTDQVTLVQADALHWLAQPSTEPAFDILFLDPPFDTPVLEPLAEALNGASQLHDGTLIYLETSRNYAFVAPPSWELLKQKFAGQVKFALYEFRPQSPPPAMATKSASFCARLPNCLLSAPLSPSRGEGTSK